MMATVVLISVIMVTYKTTLAILIDTPPGYKTLTQICAKYILLEVAQYEPMAWVMSVTTRRTSMTTGN